MYCMNCGKEIMPGAKFCSNCGTKLETGPSQEQVAFTPERGSKKPKKHGAVVAAIIGGVILVCVVLAVGIFTVSKFASKRGEHEKESKHEQTAEVAPDTKKDEAKEAEDEKGKAKEEKKENTVKPEEKEQANLSDVLAAYKEYVYAYAWDCAEYDVIYVDDDDIPEIALVGQDEATGTRIMYYADGQVKEEQLSRLYYTYIERENLLCNSEGHMDEYYDVVYSIQNGSMQVVAAGNYGACDNANVQLDANGEPIYQYYWNNKEVSFNQYSQELNAVYDTSKITQDYYSYASIDDACAAVLSGTRGNSNYILTNSDFRYVTEEEIAGLSPEELELARNEIYARHGYIFSREDLQTYFGSKTWYYPYADEVSDDMLNEYEIANRDLIKQAEGK